MSLDSIAGISHTPDNKVQQTPQELLSSSLTKREFKGVVEEELPMLGSLDVWTDALSKAGTERDVQSKVLVVVDRARSILADRNERDLFVGSDKVLIPEPLHETLGKTISLDALQVATFPEFSEDEQVYLRHKLILQSTYARLSHFIREVTKYVERTQKTTSLPDQAFIESSFEMTIEAVTALLELRQFVEEEEEAFDGIAARVPFGLRDSIEEMRVVKLYTGIAQGLSDHKQKDVWHVAHQVIHRHFPDNPELQGLFVQGIEGTQDYTIKGKTKRVVRPVLNVGRAIWGLTDRWKEENLDRDYIFNPQTSQFEKRKPNEKGLWRLVPERLRR